MRSILVAFLALLQGCTVVGGVIMFPESRYTWYRDGDPLPPRIQIVSKDEVQRACPRGFTVVACAVRLADECVIYTFVNPLPPSIREHEFRHCDGWMHVES